MNKSAIAVLLGTVLVSTATLSTFNTYAEQTVTRVKPQQSERSSAQALELTKAFIAKRQSKHPQWQNSQVGKVVSLLDTQGKIQGFEIQITDSHLQSQGYVIVEARHFGASIAEYATRGESPSRLLLKAFQKQTGKNFEPGQGKVNLLWNGPGTSGLAWTNDNNEAQFVALNPSQTIKGYSVDRSKKGVDHKAQSKVKAQLAQLKTTSAEVDWSFKPFYQEYRTWQNSRSSEHECYAGCTPIASAMLIDFYDRNGYPNLIGDETQQDHHTTSALMRETIDSLRGHLRTYCRDDGQGGTAQRDSVNLVNYMNERGEQQFKARRISYSGLSTFFYLIKEIDAQRPAIVHYNTRGTIGTNHSAIAFGYDYGGFWADNFLTVRTGWSRAEQKYYNIESMGTVEATLVSKN